MALQCDLGALNTVLSKFAGRDKLGRFVQYSCRFNKGLLNGELGAALVPFAGERLKEMKTMNWSLFVVLMNARRVYRWLSSLPHVLALKKIFEDPSVKPWGSELHPLYIVHKALMALWPAIDHYRFFVLIKWMKGPNGNYDQSPIRNFAYRFFALSQIVASIAYFRLAFNQKKGEDDVDDKKRAVYRWNFFKAVLTSITISHVSQFPLISNFTNEVLCGSTGAISSAMDVYNMWPKEK